MDAGLLGRGAEVGTGSRSLWMLGEMRTLAVVAAAGFMVAGLGLLTDQAWWTSMTIAAGAVSLVLIGLTFNVWLSLGAVVSAAALVYAATQASA